MKKFVLFQSEEIPRGQRRSGFSSNSGKNKPIPSGYWHTITTVLFAFLLFGNTSWAQFVLDGNPTEWPGILNSGVNAKVFLRDANNTNDNQFTNGSQDPDLLAEWGWSSGQTNDKGDISNAGAALLSGNVLAFFGDRTAINGDAQIGFWFFKGNIRPLPAFTFTTEHQVGDILVLSNFTNGGGAVQLRIYRWVGSGGSDGSLNLVGTTGNARVNSSQQAIPSSGPFAASLPATAQWTYQGKNVPSEGVPPANTYHAGSFFEGFIDLDDIPGLSPCITSFLLETRNSQSTTASLQDFVQGAFNGVPLAPTAGPNARCGTGSVALTASGCSGTLNWYAAASGGSSLGTGSPFNTPSISQTTTYYVSCTTNGCEGPRTAVVATINPNPTASATPTHISCSGAATGSIDLTPAGGAPSYTYAWTKVGDAGFSATSQDLSGITAGTYNVAVTDSRGCIGNASATVNEPPLDTPDITKDPGSAPTPCGASATDAQALIDTAFNTWIDAGVTVVDPGTEPYVITRDPLNPTAPPFSGGSTQVTWTITDACQRTAVVIAAFTVSNACLIECSTTPTPLVCNGDLSGSILARAANGIPPYNFYLYLSSDLTTALDSVLGVNTEPGEATFSGLAAGAYTVLITDSIQTLDDATACDVTVNEPTLLTASSDKTDVICNGESNGTMTAAGAAGSPPYTYAIDGPANTTGDATGAYTGLAAGTYTVTVTDDHGCTATTVEIIGEPTLLTASSDKTDVICNGESNGTMTAAGAAGSPPYTYAIDGPANTSGDATGAYTGLAAGTYTVTVTDDHGCTATTIETIGEPTLLTSSSEKTDVICNGESNGTMTAAGAAGSPPYTYAIDGPANTSGDVTGAYTGLAAGTYTVTVTDDHGCTATTVETIGEPTLLTASATPTAETCLFNDGAIDLTPIGGTPPYTYLWSNGATTEDLSGLAAEVYTVVVTDANGCTADSEATVGAPGTCLEGCTPGFWKNHLAAWGSTNPNADFFVFFNISPVGNNVQNINAIDTNGDGKLTLLEAISAEIKTSGNNGWFAALARHAVAAYLNASYPIDYEFTTAYILSETERVFETNYSNRNAANNAAQVLHTAFRTANERVCPIGNSTGVKMAPQTTSAATFDVYPVPFKDQLTIRYNFDYKTSARIEMFDLSGRLVMSHVDSDAYLNKEVTLKTNFKQSEVQLFIIKVTTDRGVAVKKVLSQE